MDIDNLSAVERRLFLNPDTGQLRWNGKFNVGSAIIAEPWSVQSINHYQARADDYVPSTLFDNSLFDTAVSIAALAEGGKKKSAIARLTFADVGIEPFPTESVNCNSQGYCDFE